MDSRILIDLNHQKEVVLSVVHASANEVKDRMVGMFLHDCHPMTQPLLNNGFCEVRYLGRDREQDIRSAYEIVPLHPFDTLRFVEDMLDNVEKICGEKLVAVQKTITFADLPAGYEERLVQTVKLLESRLHTYRKNGGERM